MPRSLGLPTDTSHVAGGPVDLPSPHPLGINYRPVNLLGYRLPTRLQAAIRWIHVSTIVKWSSIIGPAVYCTVLNSRPARNSFLDTEKFFRVSSLVSLVNIPRNFPAFTAVYATHENNCSPSHILFLQCNQYRWDITHSSFMQGFWKLYGTDKFVNKHSDQFFKWKMII